MSPNPFKPVTSRTSKTFIRHRGSLCPSGLGFSGGRSLIFAANGIQT